ncbi:MAG: TIGR02757 family protein [Chitinispirillia bacterium]|nr:TIGR02757 family protein [Chitinispirillia bacterium]MCL2241957.1 TIGR02757 family protein [Chitinispirillia bacterium]
MHNSKNPQLKKILDDIYTQYHHPKYLGLDPLICVRRFKDRGSREAVGMLAASLAYGRVEIIVRSINTIIDGAMDGDPLNFIISTSYKDKSKSLAKFKHRFNDGQDIAALLESIKITIKEYGSIEKCFGDCMKRNGHQFKSALTSFTGILKSNVRKYVDSRASFEYLIPSPAKGSACKRMVLYLRWMIREDDGIDLGVWKTVPASCLLIPVDTHVAKIARGYGFTNRNSADWKMAEEITSVLRQFDPSDPTRYDFALCHAGMVDIRS